MSIKSFLEHPGRQSSAVLERVVSILLEGISINAITYGPKQLAAFQSAIEGFRRDFDRAPDEESAILLVGKVIRCLEDYCAGARQCAEAQREGLNNTVEALMESLLSLSHPSAQNALNLRNLRNELAGDPSTEDLREINSRLQRCLGAISEEVERKNVAATREPRVNSDADTGLPGPAAAVHAIRTAMNRGDPAHVLAFYVEHLEAVNLRYGRKVGDQMLLSFAQRLAQNLDSDALLFRWCGPCFLVLTCKQAPEQILAAETASLADSKLEHTIKSATRDSVVPLTVSWTMTKISGVADIDTVLHQLDEFAFNRAHGRVA